MKKIKTLTLLLLISTINYAQKLNVENTYLSIKEKNWEDAKKYIDIAYEHPTTSNDPRMWYYRGYTYLEVHQYKEKNLDDEAIEKSIRSYIKCLETDVKKKYTKKTKAELIKYASLHAYNKAVSAQQNKNYTKALELYKLILEVVPYDTENDLKRNNVSTQTICYNSYLCTQELKDFEKTKFYLQKLMDLNYNDPDIYIAMSEIYMAEKDTANALKYIEQGRKKFEEDKLLINAELNHYMTIGKVDVLLKKLTDAIKANPEYALIYIHRAKVYEKINEISNAEADYKKVIEIDPLNYDANYNIGVMYYNNGFKIKNKVNAMDLQQYQKRGKQLEAQWKEYYEKSIPYFEKLYKIKQDDKSILQNLKTIYNQLRRKEDEKRIDELLKQ
ncbi:MAG: hypothetical protein FVQ77_09375 [Cytophagales bacterium]|nr:hypothetical protein [Cytophagales bacterium]